MPPLDGNADASSATVLDPRDRDERAAWERLRAEPDVAVLDRYTDEIEQLAALRPRPTDAVLAEPRRWAYYPWRRTLVAVLGPEGFHTLRLDRNRHLITAAEQNRLRTLRIGVVGLSVGHVIAHTLAAQGLCGELRLADFDTLELSNLNRVPATLFDIGENKAAVAARRIAEVDPYLPVTIYESGITVDTMASFLDGLDVVVEECDSLDVKVALREAARARGIPVVMSTSDRGLIDVERFDLDRSRAVMHGLLGDVDADSLSGMSSREKVPYVLTYLDGGRLSARMAASLVEVDRTLSTWPQLAGEVTLGAAAVAEAVRRIGLGERLASGRVRIDVGGALERLEEPSVAAPPPSAEPVAVESEDVGRLIAEAATRAPSGGNTQPWAIEWDGAELRFRLAPEYTSTLDVELRGSAVALGAAVFNARVAAARLGRLGPVRVDGGGPDGPLSATVTLGSGADAALAELYEPMLDRETNRRLGVPGELAADVAAALVDAAGREGAGLSVVSHTDQLRAVADVLAAADRLRYLTPGLHSDMISELRWPGDADPDAGIDVHSLELEPDELAAMSILRRGEVMSALSAWNAGTGLGDYTRDRVQSSCGVAVVHVSGSTLADFARGGSAVEAVWIAAERNDLAVQPISPAFLYARTPAELAEVSTPYRDALAELRSSFREVAGVGPGDEMVLILRLAKAERASVRSRRSADRIRWMA